METLGGWVVGIEDGLIRQPMGRSSFLPLLGRLGTPILINKKLSSLATPSLYHISVYLIVNSEGLSQYVLGIKGYDSLVISPLPSFF